MLFYLSGFYLESFMYDLPFVNRLLPQLLLGLDSELDRLLGHSTLERSHLFAQWWLLSLGS